MHSRRALGINGNSVSVFFQLIRTSLITPQGLLEKARTPQKSPDQQTPQVNSHCALHISTTRPQQTLPSQMLATCGRADAPVPPLLKHKSSVVLDLSSPLPKSFTQCTHHAEHRCHAEVVGVFNDFSSLQEKCSAETKIEQHEGDPKEAPV